MNNKTKELLRKAYNDVCNRYLTTLLQSWGLETDSYGFWVSDEIGGVYCYGDSLFLNMDDILYIVDNDITQTQYQEYIEYAMWADKYGFTSPNLKSFVKGCPIIPVETREKLDEQKRMLDELVKETKENLKMGEF